MTSKVNVLGIEYEIFYDVLEESDTRLKQNDAYCDFTTKQIKIAEMAPDDNTYNDLAVYKRRTLRHEIVHAFLFESGLDHNSEWARSETMVDWIAIQVPKMAELFAQLNISD